MVLVSPSPRSSVAALIINSLRPLQHRTMPQQAAELMLEDLEIKPYVITKLKNAGIESVSDLAISLPHDPTDVGSGILSGVSENANLRTSMLLKEQFRLYSSLGLIK
jgi:hypothetical protein